MQCFTRFPIVSFVVAGIASATAISAQQSSTTPRFKVAEAIRVDAPPDLDGRLDEPLWSSVVRMGSFGQLRPSPGLPASERTEVQVAYDDEALYVGVRNYDLHPDSIVARLARRDEPAHSEWFTVLVDSYHDRRTAFAFAINPAGVKRDFTIVEDAREDDSWDAVWDAAARVDAAGWTAELRIPLSQLRFKGSRDALTWGINFSRLIARRDELSYWSPIVPEIAGVVSQFGELRGLRRLGSPRGLEVQPYSVVSATRSPAEPGNPLYRSTAVSTSLGADLKYGIGSGLTLSATFNPDFGQVEADPSEVNLTAVESQFSERRPFFLEGTDILDVRNPQLFYSRRIGAPPRGRVTNGATFSDVPDVTTILAAAKLTGKTPSGWSLGVLNAVTAREEAEWVDTTGDRRSGTAMVEPRTNYFVARAIRDFRRGASAIGAVLTSVTRGSEEVLSTPRASQAWVAGLDGRHRFANGTLEIAGAALGSRVSGDPAAIASLQRSATRSFSRPDADHLDYDTTRTSLGGYTLRATLSKVAGGGWRGQAGTLVLSPGFDANELGFVPVTDRARQWVDVRFESFTAGSLFRNWRVGVGEASAWTFGRERVDANINMMARAQFLNHVTLDAFYLRYASAVSTNELRGGGALRQSPGGTGYVAVTSDQRRTVRASVRGSWSHEEGGSSLGVDPAIAIRPSSQMDLMMFTSFSRSTNPAQYIGAFAVGSAPEYLVGRLRQTTSSLTIRGDYTFSPTLSLQVYAEPFLSAGRYETFRTVSDPAARRFDDRYRTLASGDLGTADADGVRAVDLDGDARGDFAFSNPDFNVKRFNSTAVLRWEYRPGSTMYVVWGQGRDHRSFDGSTNLRRDTSTLFGTPGTNVFMIKASYWLGL